MQAIDLQKLPPREALRAVLAAYNKLQRGEEIAVTVASYPSGLRVLVPCAETRKSSRSVSSMEGYRTFSSW